jgi:hypothetical protein
MKRSKAFYTDLQDKYIIAGFDEDRFSCWCHVEKEKKGAEVPLSVTHTAVQCEKVQRYRAWTWFMHARNCKFYRVRRIGFTLSMN